jgi:hypothetical protein
MDGIIYIPYVNTDLNDDDFNYKGNAFDYITQLNNVGNSIVGADVYDNYLQTRPKNTIGFHANVDKPDGYYSDQILFYELPCKLMDVDENSMKINNLLDYFTSEENFMMIFSFDHENTNEDILVELKSWVSESKKVMGMPSDVYSEEIKIGLLPKRQFKLKLGKNNAFLNECLFFDNYDDKIVIYVKKIIFYN